MALDRTTAAHVAILLYLYPLFTALLAHHCLPGETLTLRGFTAVVVAFAGAALTAADVQTRAQQSTLAGDLLAVGSAGLWALQTIYIKRATSTADPFSIVLYPTALSMLAFIGLSSALEPFAPRRLSWPILLALGYQGIVVSAASGVAWIILIRQFHAGVLSAYTFLTPVFGALMSVLLLDEPFSMQLILGLTFVVLALAAVERRPSKQKNAGRLSGGVPSDKNGRMYNGPARRRS